jgi:hypothetical protein
MATDIKIDRTSLDIDSEWPATLTVEAQGVRIQGSRATTPASTRRRLGAAEWLLIVGLFLGLEAFVVFPFFGDVMASWRDPAAWNALPFAVINVFKLGFGIAVLFGGPLMLAILAVEAIGKRVRKRLPTEPVVIHVPFSAIRRLETFGFTDGAAVGLTLSVNGRDHTVSGTAMDKALAWALLFRCVGHEEIARRIQARIAPVQEADDVLEVECLAMILRVTSGGLSVPPSVEERWGQVEARNLESRVLDLIVRACFESGDAQQRAESGEWTAVELDKDERQALVEALAGKSGTLVERARALGGVRIGESRGRDVRLEMRVMVGLAVRLRYAEGLLGTRLEVWARSGALTLYGPWQVKGWTRWIIRGLTT